MKYVWIALCFMSLFSISTQAQELSCMPADKALHDAAQLHLDPVWQGKDEAGFSVMLLQSKQDHSWIMLGVMMKDHNAVGCLLGSGVSGSPVR